MLMQLNYTTVVGTLLVPEMAVDDRQIYSREFIMLQWQINHWLNIGLKLDATNSL